MLQPHAPPACAVVPADLARRGVDSLPVHTYPFAKTASAVWGSVHAFVTKAISAASLAADGPAGSSLVQRDPFLAAWVAQLRDADWLPSFPAIETDAQLVDA